MKPENKRTSFIIFFQCYLCLVASLTSQGMKFRSNLDTLLLGTLFNLRLTIKVKTFENSAE